MEKPATRTSLFPYTTLFRSYRLKYYQVIAPDSLGSDRFNIAAKLPAGATRDQVPEMLQSLLADRFKLKPHREPRDFPVYALIIGKGGLKIKESAAEPEASAA